MSGSDAATESRTRIAHRVLRVAEALLLLASLAGMVTFAVSVISIWRIERAAGSAEGALAGQIPWSAWYGIFIFFGSMFLLQVVRFPLRRHARRQARERAARADEPLEPGGQSYSGDTRAEAAGDETGQA